MNTLRNVRDDIKAPLQELIDETRHREMRLLMERYAPSTLLFAPVYWAVVNNVGPLIHETLYPWHLNLDCGRGMTVSQLTFLLLGPLPNQPVNQFTRRALF